MLCYERNDVLQKEQRPMYKGLEAREGYSFSLTSPSHFWHSSLTLLDFRKLSLPCRQREIDEDRRR